MVKAAISLVFGATAALVFSASSQRPDVNGTWVASTDVPTGIGAAPSPILGPRIALRVQGDSITVTRPRGDDALSVTYKLDGTPSTYRVPGRLCEGEAQVIESMKWEDAALVMTMSGRVPAGGGPTTSFNVRRLMRPAGDTLVIQGTMNQAGKTLDVATVYKRSTEVLPTPKAAPTGPAATIAEAAWISGVWSGPNGSVTVEERWTPPASGGMIGVGRTLRGAALANFEFLCIAERNGTLVYAAMPDARFPATFFTLTEITPTSATFENPAHDFPKLIRYTKLLDGSLQTQSSSGPAAKPTTFVLKREQ